MLFEGIGTAKNLSVLYVCQVSLSGLSAAGAAGPGPPGGPRRRSQAPPVSLEQVGLSGGACVGKSLPAPAAGQALVGVRWDGSRPTLTRARPALTSQGA